MILKIVLSFIILIIIPEVLGLLFTKFMKEKNNLLWAFVIGYLFEFASFELIYLPMYFADCSFKTVQYTWSAVILISVVASVILNRKRFKELLTINLKILKDMPDLILVFAVLLVIQIYVPVTHMQTIDLDDAFYTATTTTTIETNTMFKVDAYTGTSKYGNRPVRYSLSGLSIYFAALSEILNIHPATLQHTVWPAVAVILEFAVYALIGNKLLKRDKEKLNYFLIFLAITYMFGFISIYANFSFFAYRSWQGKALISNFVIPAVWLIYMYCIENDTTITYWLIFVMITISACFATGMGVFLVLVEVGVLALINLLQDRKFLNFVKLIACCLPQVVVGAIYLIFK